MNHITCRELIDFLDDYIDGQLEPESRESFERHLRVCPSCRAYLASYRDTISLARGIVDDVPIEDIPPELLTTVLATIARNTNPRR